MADKLLGCIWCGKELNTTVGEFHERHARGENTSEECQACTEILDTYNETNPCHPDYEDWCKRNALDKA